MGETDGRERAHARGYGRARSCIRSETYLVVGELVGHAFDLRRLGLRQVFGLDHEIVLELDAVLCSELEGLVGEPELVRCRDLWGADVNKRAFATSSATNVPVREPGGKAEG